MQGELQVILSKHGDHEVGDGLVDLGCRWLMRGNGACNGGGYSVGIPTLGVYLPA